MTSSAVAFYLTCLILGEMAQMAHLKKPAPSPREGRFISANVGDKVTLQCFYQGIPARLYWYKHSLGQKPRLISTFKHNANWTFHDEFETDSRFKWIAENGKNDLRIRDLRTTDTATYCCVVYLYSLEFVESITVSVEDLSYNNQSWIHQSESQIIQPGGSVTLNCTVQTGTCDGGHSVYWFKDSEESHPGLIYTHGDRNNQCKSKADTQTHTCVYNLPITNLNRSHAGTYYCAVASCGYIVFGNWTKLDIEDELDFLAVVYVLSGALTFTTILSVSLALSLYRINRQKTPESPELQARFSTPSMTNSEVNQEDVHYAALNVKQHNRSRRQRDNAGDECVYSSVKQY